MPIPNETKQVPASSLEEMKLALVALVTAALLPAATRQSADALEQEGKRLYLQAEFSRAIQTLEQAAALDPQNSTIQTWLGLAWERRAGLSSPLASSGFEKRSCRAFEKAIRLDPHNTEAADNLLDLYLQTGRIEEARSLIPTLAATDPSQAGYARLRVDEAARDYNSAAAKVSRAFNLAKVE